jgi:hypothetical protein
MAEAGMVEKSREFRAGGAALYVPSPGDGPARE